MNQSLTTTTTGPVTTAAVARLYHPSHHVPDLEDAAQWFLRVFGRPTRFLSEMFASAPPRGDYPTAYSCFTPIAEVLFDCIDPKLYVLQGKQRYETVHTPTLRGFGWYVTDMAATFTRLKELGFAMENQLDEPAEGPEPPAAATSPMPLFFTTPESTGLRYEFIPNFPFPLDHRSAPDAQASASPDEDPLGILACSHHTILTLHPERVHLLLTSGLGGRAFHESPNEVLTGSSVFVSLADATYEIVVPAPGSPAHAALTASGPADVYHSITWHVADLDATARHLRAVGVDIAVETPTLLTTDPSSSLGIPWGFTTELSPNDPRLN